MTDSYGYAALKESGALVPFSFKRRELKNKDVLIEIDFCGVCHSDIHQVSNGWKNTEYPLVPGHEIIGRVQKIGRDVKAFKEGDLVGVGVKVDSCQKCKMCKKQQEQFCEKGSVSTYNGVEYESKKRTKGGYANNIIVREEFVFVIPKNLDPAGCAPLLCAGITTYSPLRYWNVQKGMSVGIVGLGGLGHMGVKLASAMGAEVTLFTTNIEKKEDAKRLGATHVIYSKSNEEMSKNKKKLDFILNTVAAPIQLEPYLECLKTEGVMALVGLPEENHPSFPAKVLIYERRSLAGSLIGGTKETQEMLEFCSKHQITSEIEIIKIQEINEAFKKTKDGKVKYRFVIDMRSLEKTSN